MKKSITYIILLIALATAAIAQQFSRNEILLPEQKTSISKSDGTMNSSNASFSWQKVTNTKGSWSVLQDNFSKSGVRYFGTPLKIKGFDKITNKNILDAANKFVSENASLLKINPANIELVRITEVNKRWYVSYRQTYKGLPVLLSEIELRIFSNGNVMAFGAEYYWDINLSTEPTLSPEKAMQSSIQGLQFDVKKDIVLKSPNLYILPIKENSNISYHLTYKFDIDIKDSFEKYFAFVDAHNGKVLWRQSQMINVNTPVEVKGAVKLRSGDDNDTIVPFPNQNVYVGAKVLLTDEEGKSQVDISDKKLIMATFSGPWANVVNSDRTNSKFSDSISPSQPFLLSWNNTNSFKQERNVFYHANFIHNYFKKLDTSLKCMDFQLKITLIHDGNSPNAASSGKEIYFIAVGNTQYRFAESPSILYHEYGHSVNNLLYQALGREEGMINMSCHEALADATAALVLDDEIIGRGAFVSNPNQNIRDLNNTLKYPDDIQQDSHHNGLILAGAYWDLRKETSLEYVRHLTHFTRYGLPDDPNIGKSFGEWLVESLVTDDDDGDLSNGTPHYNNIVRCFAKHNIGTELFLQSTFKHTPLSNTDDTENPYKVEFMLSGLLGEDNRPDSVAVVYSTDNFRTYNKIYAQIQNSTDYFAFIPKQPRGTIVYYYVETYIKSENKFFTFSQTYPELTPFVFLVGYRTALFDDFENERGWMTGSTLDNATKGKWERAIPHEAILLLNAGNNQMYPLPLQTGQQHTPNGTMCFVTDGTGGQSQQMMMYLPDGRTSFYSPVYDISNLKNPIFKFWRWFSNIPLFSQTGYATFGVEASFDNGNSWTFIKEIKYNEDEWTQDWYRIEDYGDISSGTFQVRFYVINSIGMWGMPNSFSEALVDDFEILTGNDVILSSVEENDKVSNQYDIFPNPISNVANISISLDKNAFVSISIYDILGQQINTILNTNLEIGNHIIPFSAIDKFGNKLTPGIYFINIIVDGKTISTKVIAY